MVFLSASRTTGPPRPMCAFIWLERRTVSSKPSRLRHGHVLDVRSKLLYTHRRAAAHQWQAKHVLVTHAKHGKGHWVGQSRTWPHFTSRCSSSRSRFAGSPPELRDARPPPPAPSGAFGPRGQRLPRAVPARVPAGRRRSGRRTAQNAAGRPASVCVRCRRHANFQRRDTPEGVCLFSLVSNFGSS